MTQAEADSARRSRAARTVVVIPCYDEGARLPTARFRDFLLAHPDVAFVFVDDGSRDDTLAQLRSLERVAPERACVLALPANVGKAEAVRRGMLRALEGGADYAGYWDADLATPLSAVRDFVDLLDARPDLEIAIGSRVVLLGRRIERRTLRHYLGRVAATAIALTLGLRVYDTQCGAKLFRAGPATREIFRDSFVARWAFDVEILARLIQLRLAGGLSPAESVVCELPLSEWIDVAGTKVGALDYLRAAVDLFRIWRRYRV
ncbi:MAG: glycosyltransferase [Myxococcales bacterium]|nr:MAG: glycosyltransferase [Myxococcales bacterium]